MVQKKAKSRYKRKRTQLTQSTRKRRRADIKGTVPQISNIPEEVLNNCVINLSTKLTEVSPHQLYLFYLGKKFAPTPPLPDYSKFRLDILQFAYKLRWAWYWFCNPPKVVKDMSVQETAIKEMEKTLIKHDETKPMKVSNNHCLELFIERVTKDLLQTNNNTRTKLPDNLPIESRKALEEMEVWKDIIIRPADKGSRYFFLDREDYVKRVQEHIYDKETFHIIDKKEAEDRTKLAITNWCCNYNNEVGFTEKLYQWITPDEFCKPGNNYVNPKAHKPEKNYPGRMISTGCASAIKNLSALTAHELTKVELDYAIQDTNHILRKIDEINESGVLGGVESVIHASFDIEAMFPNISKDVGLAQCRVHLDKRKDPIFSTDCIIDALEITLDNNITDFENETFRQIKGTAMGPKNACAYADTAIDKLDHEVLDGTWAHPPILWARFRDDVYVPWTHGQDNLDRFHDWLNTRIPGIKFTVNSSEHGTEFLDLFIYVKNGKLHTKQYSKPCDDHAFLVPTSCHPSHTIRNIPYSTALRIYKHTSEPAEYDKSKLEYTDFLTARGYSIGIIMEAFRKVESKPRREYYQKQPGKKLRQESDRVIPLVTEFNPGLPNIGKILNSHKHVLKLDPELCKVVNPDGIFASFRGTKTLYDKLVHSRLPDEVAPANEVEPEGEADEPLGGCNYCVSKRCDLCKNFMKQTKTAYSFHTNSVFNIKQNVNCESLNVVYIINDLVCKVSSVGCTSDSIKVRFRNHKSHIKHERRTCEVSSHFTDNRTIHILDRSSTKTYTDSLSKQLEVIIVEQVDVSKVAGDPKSRLDECKRREWYWQNQLKTLKQYGGMNVREERL